MERKSGFSVAWLLFFIFLFLKLGEFGVVATWSWWWVFAPLWIPIAVAILVGVCVGVLTVGAEMAIESKWTTRRRVKRQAEARERIRQNIADRRAVIQNKRSDGSLW